MEIQSVYAYGWGDIGQMGWGKIANNWQGFRLSLYMIKPSKTRSWRDGVLSETQTQYLSSETQRICQQCWPQVAAGWVSMAIWFSQIEKIHDQWQFLYQWNKVESNRGRHLTLTSDLHIHPPLKINANHHSTLWLTKSGDHMLLNKRILLLYTISQYLCF